MVLDHEENGPAISTFFLANYDLPLFAQNPNLVDLNYLTNWELRNEPFPF